MEGSPSPQKGLSTRSSLSGLTGGTPSRGPAVLSPLSTPNDMRGGTSEFMHPATMGSSEYSRPRIIPFHSAGSVERHVDASSAQRVPLPSSNLPATAALTGSEFDLPGKLFGSRSGTTAIPFHQDFMSSSPTGVAGTTSSPQDGSPASASGGDSGSAWRGPRGIDTTATRTRAALGVGSEVRRVGGEPPLKAIVRQPLEESTFLSELLFVWMGVDQTEHIRYDLTSRSYEMHPDVGSAVQRHALSTLQACGVLARSIDEVLRRASSEVSFLQQSLRGALRHQLTQYHCLLGTIRERPASGSLSMADVVVAYKRVYPKLWVMHHTLEETESVKGGELASKLQALMQQGSHRLSSLLKDIYVEAVSPLLHMTVSAISKGEVSDPFNEFFIVSDPQVEPTSDLFWAKKYALRPSMVPRTVSRAVAEDILLVTKNLNFIRTPCRARQWRMDPSVVAEAERASFDTLAGVVRRALVFSNTAVLRFVREQYKLEEVLRLVNAFLLVGYGDFYELLIRKMEPILSKLSPGIQVSYVRDQVESALAEIAPYAKHLDPDRFPLLHCELMKDESKLGWDAFVMTMTVASPLNNIFDLTALKVYRRLFRLLFKVKVAEVSLKNAWRQSVSLDRLIGGLQRDSREINAWRGVAADAHLLGLQLNHFVMNLWSYLVSEVSMVAWDLLRKAMSRCRSLDEIRVAHNAYLAYLTQRSLLHNDCATIRLNIENILTIVREYCGSQALLTSLLERGAGEIVSITRQYQSLTDDFDREVSALLTVLEEQHLQYDFLNFLLLRLNFNRYYHDSTTAANTDF